MKNIVAIKSKDVKEFDFLGMKVRATSINGEPWAVAKDVAEILGYTDAQAMTRRLEEDETQNRQIVGIGNRGINLINESGLYASIFGSRKKEAKRFRKFVTDTILPEIRKTGEYRSANKTFSRLELIEMARDSELKAIALETQLVKAQPLIEFAEQVKTSSQINTCRNAGKLINQRPNKFCQWLLNEGYTYESSQGRVASQKAIYLGVLEMKKVKDRHDESKFRNQIFVTNKGLAYFSEKLMGVEL